MLPLVQVIIRNGRQSSNPLWKLMIINVMLVDQYIVLSTVLRPLLLVHRAFPSKYIEDFDPFLLLDEFGPMVLSPGEAKGAPDHPHRGFETVTYMLSGQFEHKDSQIFSGDMHL
jgi:quercetin 2,3-dioxygenase